MLPYRLATGTLRAVSPLLGFGDSKLARGIVGRRYAAELLATWGRSVRDPARPTVWVHAPSVGEGLQAKAVMDALRALDDETQFVFTFFSPSAERLAREVDADVAAYLPWDTRGTIRAVLDAVQPHAVVFTRTEAWPVLATEADRRGCAVAMIGGTLPEDAGRMRWPARSLLRPVWRRMSALCAVSDGDAGRFVQAGASAEAVTVTGDPAVDSAALRVRGADVRSPWLAPFLSERRETVVAGSTRRSDEDMLVPAVTRVRTLRPRLRLIVAPHEPTSEHLAPLDARLRDAGWTVQRLSAVEALGADPPVADAVIVDRVGPLAALYRAATVAFVGGGFDRHGLHSVLEPAAAGVPVLFGPCGQRNVGAAALLDGGGAKIAADADHLAGILEAWLADDEERARRGRAAADYIDAQRGAADRSARLLHTLLRPEA